MGAFSQGLCGGAQAAARGPFPRGKVVFVTAVSRFCFGVPQQTTTCDGVADIGNLADPIDQQDRPELLALMAGHRWCLLGNPSGWPGLGSYDRRLLRRGDGDHTQQ